MIVGLGAGGVQDVMYRGEIEPLGENIVKLRRPPVWGLRGSVREGRLNELLQSVLSRSASDVLRGSTTGEGTRW